LNEELIWFRVKNNSRHTHLAWARGIRFGVPDDVLANCALSNWMDASGSLNLPPEIGPVDNQAIDRLRLRAAFTDCKPLSSRLPVSYQMVPAKLRSVIAGVTGHWKRKYLNRRDIFPAWPLDLSADFLTDLAKGRPSPYSQEPTPVLLTHDIDSAEGLDNLLAWFVDLEEELGARSCNYIVPFAWPLDHKRLQILVNRGHEVGVHGYDHSNQTPFADAINRKKRIGRAAPLIQQYDIWGYRAPSLLRTRPLLKDLAKLYRYDSSIPTSGGVFPVPGNGCASARPFNLAGLTEIPVSLPRDGSLRFLGHTPEQILDIWCGCAEKISLSGGVVVLLTHCDRRFSGNKSMLRIYKKFLAYIDGNDRFRWSSPKEIIQEAHGQQFNSAKKSSPTTG
jgi:hypothetical protein